MESDEPPELSKKIVARLHESPSSVVYTTTLLADESHVVVVKRTKITGPNGARAERREAHAAAPYAAPQLARARAPSEVTRGWPLQT